MADWKAHSYVKVAFSICISVGACLPVWGDSLVPPDPSQLIEALKATGRTRGSSVGPAEAEKDNRRKHLFEVLQRRGTRGLSVEDRQALPEVVDERPSVDLEVYFDYNSADITAKAEPTLDSLGKALQDSALKGKNFLLAGHTDAKGGEAYNQELSERRAQAVKRYLTENYDVPEFELVPVGYGKAKLKIQDDPYDSRNRRVQVVNMGESTDPNGE